MEQHDLQQGAPEWHQFRLEHYGSSECASMLGLSKTTTRNALLHAKHTGLSKEFSDFVQKNILDYGHEVEAKARPLVEQLIGKKLYPVTCSNGVYSASCDGLTMDDKIAFEHKQWNEEYAAMVSGGDVPEEHIPQCQQVLMVTGAEKLYFVISDGTPDKFVYIVVLPSEEWFARIVAGWYQFGIDLAAYEPPEVIEKPVADAIMQLPSVTVQVTGALSACNLSDVTPLFDKFLGEANTQLVTDDDFANGEATAKFSRTTAKKLKLKAVEVVDQIASVSEAVRTLELYAAKFDKLGLVLEKAVTDQKETIKRTIAADAKRAFMDHVDALYQETKPIELAVPQPDFNGVMKYQSTLESLRNKVNTELARVKIEADAVAKDIRGKLADYKITVVTPGYEPLFRDLQTIIYKPVDDFRLVIMTRIDVHKKSEAEKIEAQRAAIQKEEQEKAEAKVLAEKLAEAHAKQHSESLAEAIEHVAAKGEAAIKTSITESGSLEVSVRDIRPPSPPSRAHLIEAVARAFSVAESTAEQWLTNEFQQQRAA